MLTDDFPFLLPSNAGGNLPARLRTLADDLARIESGAGPGADELANAPLIIGWRTVLSPVGLRLLGSVTGHPLLGDGAAMTSQLWAADSWTVDQIVDTFLQAWGNLSQPHQPAAVGFRRRSLK